MKKNNVETKGFYPGLSVCCANGKYYLVSTSFHRFPGVFLFESKDLVNWHPIGHVLIRKITECNKKTGDFQSAFSPNIYYNDGCFYMVAKNDITGKNFYICTKDIYGEWSEPIIIEQNGSEPSLLFNEEHVYFLSNGTDDDGKYGVVQCEIDITTGKKISESKCIWEKSDGYFQENPRMYHIGDRYYLMVVEGCSEYGRKSVYTTSDSVWGPFRKESANQLLKKCDKTSYMVREIGHGELIRSESGEWYFMCLGFRQIHMWRAYHIMGREVLQIPVILHKDGRLTAETDGMIVDVI